MKTRELGKSGVRVSAIGLGCMGMSEFYGASDDLASVELLRKAVDLGISFFDTADMYGAGHNEKLRPRLSEEGPGQGDHRHQVRQHARDDGTFLGISGKPDYVKAACDMSLKRLGVDHIDLYYQHRVDPSVPIEETVGAMAELVRPARCAFWDFLRPAPATIRRAHKVHPITALQTEYSLWTRDLEGEILATCRELGVGSSPTARSAAAS